MKKKIFINGRFLTQSITGVQRTAHQMTEALDKLISAGTIDSREYEFILIAPKGNIADTDFKNIRCIQRGLFSGHIWEQLELPFYTFRHLLISMGSISSLLKRKQLVTVHDAATFSDPAFFRLLFRTWYRTAIRILSRTALQIITVSHYSKEQLIKYTGIKENRISVIYNSADHINRFAEPDEEFKKKIGLLQPFMLGVSSLHRHKNFELLSRAVVKANLAEYKIVIAGGASSKSFSRVELDDSIIVLGYISNEQLKYLYSKAALFIFPSLFEGFGIPPLEAMIQGCPVLSSNTTALPEVLGDACEYFDPNSEADLVAKLEGLVNNKDRLQELRKKGYARAALYSWEDSATALFRLIKRFSGQHNFQPPIESNAGAGLLYKMDGGKAYHSGKHFETKRSVSIISAFRVKKFQPFISADDKVLEYGVGAGWNLRNLRCAERLGYDVSTIVKPSLDEYGIDFTNDPNEIPKHHFDVVICHHVLEHVPNPLETLKELRTYLKPAGKLLLFVPTDASPRFNRFNPRDKNHHLFSWNVQTLCALANESGFRVEEYKRRFYGFDRFISNWIDKLHLPRIAFYPMFYCLNFIRPDREIRLICNLPETAAEGRIKVS